VLDDEKIKKYYMNKNIIVFKKAQVYDEVCEVYGVRVCNSDTR